MFLISGSDISPYFRAALSPNARERASPGPQLFFPGAQILLGPEYLSLPISIGWITPPLFYILAFSFGWSGLWSTDNSVVVIPWPIIALESPTLIVKMLFSKMMIPKKVQPENDTSIPEMSSSNSVFFRIVLIWCVSIFFSW